MQQKYFINPMIPKEGQERLDFSNRSESKKSLQTQKFRIRSVSKGKQVHLQQSKIANGESGVMVDSAQNRSSSLKQMRRFRFQTKPTEANNDSSSEERIDTKRNLKTQQTQIEMIKRREIAKIFNPRTIMKLGRKYTQNSHDGNCKQHTKDESKRKFRHKKYLIQNSQLTDRDRRQPDSSEDYWKKVNQSLILVQPQNGIADEISKDLRQLYDKI